jgi:protein-S-isoprenylcysteine O-methyltransferase Ste14
VDILRLMLFMGLVLHKLLWELLKRREKARKTLHKHSTPVHLWAIKSAKVVVLIFLALQTLFLEIFPIAVEPTPLRIIGSAIYVLGFATAVIGRLQLGNNWVDLEDYQVLQKQSLMTHGIYRYIRHPIYTGDLLLLIGLELALNSWLVLGLCVPLLIVIRQVLAEEALLSQAFPGYTMYRTRTKRFIPFIV